MPTFIVFFAVKKDTLKLHKYEENLLLYYKKYLQKLERLSNILIKKKGDQRHRSEVSCKKYFGVDNFLISAAF